MPPRLSRGESRWRQGEREPKGPLLFPLFSAVGFAAVFDVSDEDDMGFLSPLEEHAPVSNAQPVSTQWFLKAGDVAVFGLGHPVYRFDESLSDLTVESAGFLPGSA